LATEQARPAVDETDRRILGALLEDPSATVKALAHRLGLAESTTAYRLRALRDLVLDHITVHRVVRSTETQLVFELREGTALLTEE